MTVLRIYGERFDVERFLGETPMRVCRTIRKGEPSSSQPGAAPETENGVHVSVSLSDWDDFAAQLRDVEGFVGGARPFLASLRPSYGAERIAIDIPTNRRLGVVVHGYAFPPALLASLGALGIELAISVYPPDLSHEDPAESRVVKHPEVCAGRPVIRGTHVLVRNIVGMLADGLAAWQIREHYPDVTAEDIAAAVAYVQARADSLTPDEP